MTIWVEGNLAMGRWLLDWLECDPLQWWVELAELWNSHDLKDWLRSRADGQGLKLSSEEDEENNLISWEGGSPNNWTRNS